jgi:hypothetical protein
VIATLARLPGDAGEYAHEVVRTILSNQVGDGQLISGRRCRGRLQELGMALRPILQAAPEAVRGAEQPGAARRFPRLRVDADPVAHLADVDGLRILPDE